MNRCKLTVLIVCSLSCFIRLEAISNVQIVLQDIRSHEPIQGVHVFIDHTQIYAISNVDGQVQLTSDEFKNQELVIYHSDYNLTIVSPDEYSSWSTTQIMSLTTKTRLSDSESDLPFGNRKWKRALKELEKGLIGNDFVSKKCEILNPDIIQFSRNAGKLSTYTNDVIRIQNPLLQYELNVVLEKLEIENRQVDFEGYYYFKDLNYQSTDSGKIHATREEAYLKNIRTFFKLLFLDQLESQKIKIRICRFERNDCQTIVEPRAADLIEEMGEYYEVRFPEFLEVVHQNIRNISEDDQPTFGGGPLGQRFDNTYRIERVNVFYGTTYFYNLGSALKVNRNGRILNPEEVKIYGYWARPRLGMELPYEFQ